jgi:hypothetical protein
MAVIHLLKGAILPPETYHEVPKGLREFAKRKNRPQYPFSLMEEFRKLGREARKKARRMWGQ